MKKFLIDFIILSTSLISILAVYADEPARNQVKKGVKSSLDIQWRYPCFINSYTTDFGKVMVVFTHPVIGVRAQDLTVNGSPATEVEKVSHNTFDQVEMQYTFSGYVLPKLGKVAIVLQPGSIKRTDNKASFEGKSWECRWLNSQADDDSDGLNNDQEINTFLTDPTKADTDDDGLPDAYELKHNCLDPINNEGEDQENYGVIVPGNNDADHDGLSNLEEFKRGMDPCAADK